MATISTSQDFDSAARVAGEAFTVNTGAVLTINTDTRWHKNAPTGASWGMGTLGAITLNVATGGTILIDARNVRWIPYTGGSGNVPALGTTITGNTSGITGELLGVYSALNVAPTAAGSGMPASGFLKFKSTSGTFNTSESLSGITASTNGTQVVGWIEVARDDITDCTISRTSLFQSRGDWFYLDNTNGSRAQVIQCPCTGGAGHYIPGVWIETGVETNAYEFWPSILGDTYFGASHLGTDERSKFVQCIGSGQIRIGRNGAATDVGALPISGCKVRIPNILLVGALAASRASTSVPHATLASRPDFTTTSAGLIDMEYAIGQWYFSLSQAYSASFKHIASFDQFSIAETATAITLEDFHVGNYNNSDVNAAILTSNFAGGTATNCKWGRTGTIAATDYGTNCSYCFDFTFTGCHFQNRAFRTNATGYPAYFSYCSGLVFTDCVAVGNTIGWLACLNTNVTNFLYADAYHQISTGTSTGVGAFYVGAGCVGTKIVGGGWYSSIANVHHDACYLYCLGATNVRWQQCGTRVAPIDCGNSNAMLYAFVDGGNNFNVELKRVYFQNVATRFYNGINSTKGILLENCSGDYADSLGTSATAGFVGLDGDIKGMGALSQYTAFTSVYGTIFYNIYTSVTAGRLGLAFNEDTSRLSTYVTKSFSGASGFISTGTLSLQVLNNYIIYEYPYWIYGIDSFQNAVPTKSGTNTANHTVEYQIDTGGGWNGSWKDSTGANLSGESFTCTGGFRLKIKITCNTASVTNALTALYILTNANTTAQDVQYPLDVITLSMTVTDESGSPINEALAYIDDNDTSPFIMNTTTNSSGIATVTYGEGPVTGARWRVRKYGYKNFKMLVDIGSVGINLPVSLVADPQQS